MPDLGTYDTDVDFAWDAASRLKHSFLRAARELEEQIPRRNGYAAHAMRDWRGRYAQEFEGEHMAAITGDARRLAAECRRCAEMLEQLAQLAREENHRRALAREWAARHEAWEREQAHRNIAEKLWDAVGGDDEPKPPDLPETRPHPLVAEDPGVGARG